MAERNGGNGKHFSGVPDRVVRVELISFYHRNPHLCESPEAICACFEYDPEQVCRQLEELVRLNILERAEMDGSVFYRYLPPFSRGDLKGIRYSPALNGMKGLGTRGRKGGAGPERA